MGLLKKLFQKFHNKKHIHKKSFTSNSPNNIFTANNSDTNLIVSSLKNEIDELKNTNEKLIQLKKDQELKLEEEIEKLEDFCYKLEKSKKEQEQNLEDEIDDLKKTYKTFKIKQKETEFILEEKLQIACNEIKLLRNNQGDLTLSTSLGSYGIDNKKQDKLKTKLSDSLNEINSLKQEIDNLRQNIDTLKTNESTLNNNFIAAEEHKNKLQQELNLALTLKEKNDKLQRDLNTSLALQKQLEERLDKLQNQPNLPSPIGINPEPIVEIPVNIASDENLPPAPPAPIPPAPPPPKLNTNSKTNNFKTGGIIDITKAKEVLKHVTENEKELPYLHDVVDIHKLKMEKCWAGLIASKQNEIVKLLEIENIDKLEPDMKHVICEIVLSLKLEKNPSVAGIKWILQENKNKIRTYYQPLKIQAISELLASYAIEEKKNNNNQPSILQEYLHGTTSQLSFKLSKEKETDPNKILIKMATRELPNNMPEIYNSIRRYLGYTTEQRQTEENQKRDELKKIYRTFILLMSEYIATNSATGRKRFINDLLTLSDSKTQPMDENHNKLKNWLDKLDLDQENTLKLMTAAKKNGLEDKVLEYTLFLQKILISTMANYYIKCVNIYLKELDKPAKIENVTENENKPLTDDKCRLFSKTNSNVMQIISPKEKQANLKIKI